MAKNSGSNAERSEDTRFSSVHSDPKFRETKAKKFKIKLDDRFSEQDLEFKRKAKVDKYGRRLKGQNDKEKQDFEKYYEKDTPKKPEQSSDEEEESSDDKEDQDEVAVSAKKISLDRARGEVPSDYVSSSDEDSSSSESEPDSGDSDLESDESEIELEDKKPDSGESSKTLAVVNLDWDHVKSEDLMITFASFVPKGGKIKKIAIYPSEFGKERLNREQVEGPPREIFASKKKSKKSSQDDDSDSDLDVKDLYEEGDAEDYDAKSLRRYQLERLRYYYAVVYCSSIETAESIYKNCDGTEFESTANMFDLRYVPDGMDFDDEARDECTELPKNYRPAQFSTDALQHSKVKLTWDETPADRVSMAKRAFSQKEIDEMDFKAYLASDSEESDQEENHNLKDKLKALANQSAQVGDRSLFDEKPNEGESDVDMQITFAPGLAERNEETRGSGDEKTEETTVEKIRRKEKERRKMRKERIKELKKQTEEEKKQKLKESRGKKTFQTDNAGDAKSAAELELLMMEDESADGERGINKKAHFNMNEIMRSEKEKSKKSKFQDKRKITDDEFKPDLNDPRFSEVFEDHDFAIDPSQPEFKQTPAMKQILQERNKRSHKNKNKKRSAAETDSSGKDADVKGLVSKIKRSAQKNKKFKKNT
ncbi:LAME_0D02850g1_1 [Lachancea meyersii CBS 8951]|uniref:LAME_0D02850g1_1 n=1 Tax=Lachancea meyersii CBS 8951 TaxID=1266667 RepID=A0A1G4J7F0_9SACH|nr:LAME_0D02850g1_1 [Lachancea meyersii CBS 8951]